MKKILFPRHEYRYKACMHLHTTVSDGRMSPEEVKDIYQKKGYSIVAYTDHELMVGHDDLRDENFLPINSYEIAMKENLKNVPDREKKTYHLNLYSKLENQKLQPVLCEKRAKLDSCKKYLNDEIRKAEHQYNYCVAEINEVIQIANDAGFLVSYNHPVWSLQNYTDYAGLRGLWGVEVYNNECYRLGYPDTVRPFEDLLREGEFVFPLATDDAHSKNSCGGGWIMVDADKLEYETVMIALEDGDFYASTGPQIYEISIEEGILHVECSEASSILVSAERRDSKHVSAEKELLTQADFDLTKYISDTETAVCRKKPYIRVTVVDQYGKSAWSRPYSFNELICSTKRA